MLRSWFKHHPKKGKIKDLTRVHSVNRIPETYGISANLNYKTEKLNYFTSTGYDYRTTQGGGLTDAEYFNLTVLLINILMKVAVK
jgi:hypothetical protein